MNSRVPPQDLQAEAALLGSLLLDGGCAIEKVLPVVSDPDAFCRDDHRQLFAALIRMHSDGKPVDIVTLEDDLRAHGKLESVGGRDYLIDLSESVPSVANVRYHAEIVRDKHRRRCAILQAHRLVEAAYDGNGAFSNNVGPIVSALAGLHEGRKPSSSPVLVNLGDVEPEPVEWLWPARFPAGKLSLLVGDPGLGKSFVVCDIASRLTTGTAWPDSPQQSAETGSAILLTAEDGLADTIRPRIDLLQGDPSGITILTGVRRAGQTTDAPFCLANDLPALEAAIAQTSAQLVTIDPLSAYLGDRDSYRDSEVRGILAPLAALAERHRTAVIGIMHLGKDTNRKALYRANASIAFTAAPRSVWAIARDPNDEHRSIMVNVKLNVAQAADGIGFRIIDGALAWDADPVTIDADTALSYRRPDDGGGNKLEEAKRTILELLATGRMGADELEAECVASGVTPKTFHRARSALKKDGSIRPVKPFDGPWSWELVTVDE